MKPSTRILALMLALVMLASLLPLEQLRLVPRAAAAPDQGGSRQSDPPPITDISIDYEYGQREGVTDVNGALRALADDPAHNLTMTATEAQFRDNYNQFPWKQAKRWSYTDRNDGDLRKYMESTDDADKYIVLTGDDTHSRSAASQDWTAMHITTDKVLDLNGHVLEVNLSTNRRNKDDKREQNATTLHAHYETLFLIDNGATLTIIDSSAWRGENAGMGSGKIHFNGYMIDPYAYDIWTYSTRDLFNVSNGNLIIYGGTFQAGRKKDQLKSNFSWDKLKTVIGSAVQMGVAIADYATGLNTAVSGYQDLLKQQANDAALHEKGDTKQDDGKGGEGDSQTNINHDGKNLNAAEEIKKDDPKKEGGGQPTVDEKKNEKDSKLSGKNPPPGTKEGENKKDSDKPAKYDVNTKLAEQENNIVNNALNPDKINGIVTSAFGLVENICGMFGEDSSTRVTNCVMGTVVKVGANSTFVAYGGTFKGYGSTPNVRNAVVEVVKGTGPKSFDHTKSQGGLAYIFGGTFEAYHGANVFNMVRANNQIQNAVQQSSRVPFSELSGIENLETSTNVAMTLGETSGVEVIYYENQDQLGGSSTVTPIPVNTANIQVRGGTFRCEYDLMNVGLRPSDETDDSVHFSKFPGTMGCVNLGVESFNEKLIKDGRIQIVDVYGDGAQVLLDDKSEEKRAWQNEHPNETYPESIYEYRLFCGDTELRSKFYLNVMPNTAKVNCSNSMQLTYYDFNTGINVGSVYKNDEDNSRAALRQMESFFDFPYTDVNANAYAILPRFFSPAHNEGNSTIPENMLEYDVYGENLANSEVWYYPRPLQAGTGEPLPDTPYGYGSVLAVPKADGAWKAGLTLGDSADTLIEQAGRWAADDYTVQYTTNYHSGVRTNLAYYIYRLYRVDPLTRENLSESKTYGVDEPLLEVRYGGSPEALKCKFPLLETQNWIMDPDHPERNPHGWQGFQPGEMYRVELDWEECIGVGYQGNGVFGQKLPTATSVASILFRCIGPKELKASEDPNITVKVPDYTPLQWKTDYVFEASSYDPDLPIVAMKPGQNFTVQLVNGKAGMTDYESISKILDVYYQWWECDEQGNELGLLAGTDNVYDKSLGYLKEAHKIERLRPSSDGKHYCNTVDPNDPRAYTYLWNGLPGYYDNYGNLVPDTDRWNCYNLHWYSSETTDAELYTDHEGHLALENNDVFKTNKDSCYIPAELEGKYIKVKAIVLNEKWPAAYDPKQTFESHVVHLTSTPRALDSDLSLRFTEGVNYAAAGKDVTIALQDVKGLSYGEKITSVYYKIGTNTKEYNNLDLDNPALVPSVSWPSAFYSAANQQLLPAGERTVQALVKTNRHPAGILTEEVPFNFHIEATGVRLRDGGKVLTNYEDIRNKSGWTSDDRPIVPVPDDATVGIDYEAAVSSNPEVATLGSDGRVIYHGGVGRTSITLAGPDGRSVTAEVFVYHRLDKIDVSGLMPPTVGAVLPKDYSVDEDAPFTVTDFYWTENRSPERLAASETAKNYHVYTVNLELQADENYIFAERGKQNFQLTALLADGSTAIMGKESLDKVYSGKLEYTQLEPDRIRISYTFDGLVGEASGDISEVYLDFNPNVKEGDNFDLWLEELSVYTNGDDTEFDKQTPRPYGDPDTAGGRLHALGPFYAYEQLRSFMQELVTGVEFKVNIPSAFTAAFPTDGSLKLYVNGREAQQFIGDSGSKQVWVMAEDLVEVQAGTAPEPIPAYQLNSFRLAKNKALYLPDLLICEDQRLSIRLTGITGPSGVNVDSYLSYDEEAETLSVLNSTTYKFQLNLEVRFDADGDGRAEYVQSYLSAEQNLGSTGAAVGSASSTHSVKLLNPDGSTWQTVSLTRVASWGGGQLFNIPVRYGAYPLLKVPEVPDAFISKLVAAAHPNTKLSLHYGPARTDAADLLTTDTNLTAYTVPAESIEIHPGATEVFAFVKDGDGNEVQGINISLDGVHFQRDSRITGLQPETEYLLYYRQGVDGIVYTKSFRTAAQEYRVYVGRVPVTDENLGSMEEDGWSYEPADGTLTLRNFTLKDCGVTLTMQAETKVLSYESMIYAENDLTVRLLGDNALTAAKNDTAAYGLATPICFCFYSLGDLTITGPGNLSMTGNTVPDSSGNPTTNTYGCGAAGEVYLRSPGTMRFTDLSYGAHCIRFSNDPSNGKVHYVNGNLIWTPLAGSDSYRFCNGSMLDISAPYHGQSSLTILADGVSKTPAQLVTYLGSPESLGKPLSISQSHGYNQQAGDVAYLVPGSEDCTVSCSYYKSCLCGAKGTDTFTITYTSHNVAHHEGLAPTCAIGGYAAYNTCTRCAYSTWQALEPLGHEWVYHEELAASCTEDGHPAYYECPVCGLSSQTVIPTGEPGDAPTRDGALAMTISDAYDTGILVWKAHGHDLKQVIGTSPSCTGTGVRAHYQCVYCGKRFSDLNCGTELSAASLTLPASGHCWSPWTITTEPTATQPGVRTQTCETCGATYTESVPISERKHFVDVARTSYYFSAVENLCDAGVVNGTSETTFSPNQPCTRAQVVTFLWRNAGSPAATGSNPFTDVKSGAWYYDAVLWAVKNGVTTGTSATAFSPSLVCSRAQAVTLLWRAKGSPEPKTTENPFTDVSPSAWYCKAVLWAVENGITNGTGAKTFSPDQACSRAQTVTLLDRMNSLPKYEGALAVGEDPQGGSFDPISSDPCYILSAEGEHGLAPYSYEWYMVSDTRAPDRKLEGANLSSVAAFEPGSYYCVITDAQGSHVTTAPAAVTTVDYPAISITTQPKAGAFTPKEPYLLSVKASGGAGTLRYQWYRDNVEIPGATESSYLADAHAGSYKCVVSDRLGNTKTSSSVNVQLWGANSVNVPTGSLTRDLFARNDLLMYVRSVTQRGRYLEVTADVVSGILRPKQTVTVHRGLTNGSIVTASYYVNSIKDTNGNPILRAGSGQRVRMVLLANAVDVPTGSAITNPQTEFLACTGVYTGGMVVNLSNGDVDTTTSWTIVDKASGTTVCTGKLSSLGLLLAESGSQKRYAESQLSLSKPAVLAVGREYYLKTGSKNVATFTVQLVQPNRVPINEITFPDPEFREIVRNAFDGDSNLVLSEAELADATSIYLEDIEPDVRSFKGIEFFNEITDVFLVGFKNLRYLDLRGNWKLKNLEVYDNNLAELHLEGLNWVTYLDCESNNLTSLDVSDQTRMTDLYVYDNPNLSSLVLGSKPNLQNLSCHRTELPSLDLSDCPLLLKTYREGKRTTAAGRVRYDLLIDGAGCCLSIDPDQVVIPAANPGCPDRVAINETNFPDPVFRNYVKGEFDGDNDDDLNAAERGSDLLEMTHLTGLVSMKGIEFFPNMVEGYLSDNPDLLSLDLQGNKQLDYLEAAHNESMSEIHLNGLSALRHLDLNGSNLSALDLRGLTSLNAVLCNDNVNLSSLLLGHNSQLRTLDCSGSKVSNLDLREAASLSYLFCYDTEISVLNLSGCPILLDLYQNGSVADNGSTLAYTKTGVYGYLQIDKDVTVLTGN